ncbi:hypothetical protein JCM8208_003911 [Rhodotorula glutinis]
MPRQPRSTTRKAIKYTDVPPSSEDEDEDAEMTDASESASVASSSRRGGAQQDQEDEEWSQGAESDDEPVRKKARTSASSTTTATKSTTKTKIKGKGRGRAGKLSAFLAMPLDILVEISRHLDPPSLLSMSRSNKMMRGVFAHRSAAPIWAIVRGNVDLPALEATDLSEMAFASLVFERNCHLCGRGRASIVDYALRVRWCKTCQRANLDNPSRLRKKIDGMHPKTLECSLFTNRSATGRGRSKNSYYCAPHAQAVSDKLHELDAQTSRTSAKKVKKRKAQVKVEDGDEIKADEVVVNGLEAYVEQRREIVAASQKDAAALVQWERSSLSSRKETGDAARKARRDAITARLLSLGYDEADCAHLVWSSVSNLVDQPTQLTDTIWNRISPKIIEQMEAEKANRLFHKRMRELYGRLEALKPRYAALHALQIDEAHTTFPSYIVFSLLPSVEPFWFFDDADTSDEAWDTALPVIVEEVDVARRVIKVGYARKLVEVFVEAGAPVDAALVKKLEAPTEPIQSSGVLIGTLEGESVYNYTHHNLMRATIDLGDTAVAVTDGEFDGVFSQLVAAFSVVGYTRVGSRQHFPAVHQALRSVGLSALVDGATSLPSALVKQILDVLKRAGLPNDQSSTAKLEALGPVFVCHGCHRGRFSSRFIVARLNTPESLGWNDILNHALQMHMYDYSYGTLSSEIRLTSSTYPPDPPADAANAQRALFPGQGIVLGDDSTWPPPAPAVEPVHRRALLPPLALSSLPA